MRTSLSKRQALIGAVAMAAISISGCTAPDESADVVTGEWRIISGTLSDGSPLELSAPMPTVVFTDGTPRLFQECLPPTIRSANQTEGETCLSEDGLPLESVLPVSPTLARDGEAQIVTGADPDLRLQLYPSDSVVLADLVGTWTTTQQPGWMDPSATTVDIADDGVFMGVANCQTFAGTVTRPSNRVLKLTEVEVEPIVNPADGSCDNGPEGLRLTPGEQLATALEAPLLFHVDEHGHLKIIPEGRNTALEFVRTGDTSLDDLSGTSWLLTYAHDSTGPITASTEIEIYFRDDGISGTLQCGSWSAPSDEQRGEARESAQNLLPIMARHTRATPAVCQTGPFMERYLSALATVTSADILDNSLILAGDGVDLRFDRFTMELSN